VTEACNGDGEEFGDARLLEAIGAAPGGSAIRTRDVLLAAHASFTGDAARADDMTLVIACAV
jgi:serine phosphatase RsbU (regulator of sigma subunit)